MYIKIELHCPRCQSGNIVRNGKKSTGQPNYLCKECRWQFIADHERTYRGTISQMNHLVSIFMVRGVGVRDLAACFQISVGKVLSTLKKSEYRPHSKQSRYDCLEIDEFWTYVGKKSNKIWLIYAYHRVTGEILAYVWGKRDTETAKRFRKQLRRFRLKYDRVAANNWESFVKEFKGDRHDIGKRYTKGIEGNNCRLRHRVRRAFRRTCCFSKVMPNHIKALDMAFFYINHGYI